MHLLSLPRHRIETTLSDYAQIMASLARSADRPGAIARFERAFCDYLGCRHAIAVSSGRLGIHLILEQLDFKEGDEVITPAFNLFAAIERFCQFGLVPRFCDVRREDLNIDPSAAEATITPRTRIILATHMYGHPADMTRMTELARRNDLVLLEDCAHALGSKWRGRHVGTFGKAAIFSFSVLKLVTTFGGGMIATSDDDLAAAIRDRLRSLRRVQPRPSGVRKAVTGSIMDVGTRKVAFSFAAWPMLRLMRAVRPDFQQKIMTESPHPDRAFDPACVPPLHPFQARLGQSQLTRAERFIERRRNVGRWLDAELQSMPQLTTLTPLDRDGRNGLYYGVLVDRPGELSRYLFRHGIDSETSEYLNCADLDMYRDHFVDCPVAREVQSQILRLPNYSGLSRKDVRRIGDTIRAFYSR